MTHGERVKFKSALDGSKQTGRITSSISRYRVRVKTDAGRLEVVPVKSIRPVKDSVMILESNLEKDLQSERQSGTFLKEVLRAYHIKPTYVRVHSAENLEFFLKVARRREVRYLHFSCHGHAQLGDCELELTHDRVSLRDNPQLFAGLHGAVLIFSACEIGSAEAIMTRLKEISGAELVVCYKRKVHDHYTNMAEHLLYHYLLANRARPLDAVRKAADVLQYSGIRTDDTHRLPLLNWF
ncbi:MAG: CHAT domain-containing protein [Candidatus Xenobia bacterium]